MFIFGRESATRWEISTPLNPELFGEDEEDEQASMDNIVQMLHSEEGLDGQYSPRAIDLEVNRKFSIPNGTLIILRFSIPGLSIFQILNLRNVINIFAHIFPRGHGILTFDIYH